MKELNELQREYPVGTAVEVYNYVDKKMLPAKTMTLPVKDEDEFATDLDFIVNVAIEGAEGEYQVLWNQMKDRWEVEDGFASA